MLWVILLAGIFFLSFTIFAIRAFNFFSSTQVNLREQRDRLSALVKIRESVFQELSGLVLGFVPRAELESLKEELALAEEKLIFESDKLNLARAELKVIQQRLAELVELEQELLSSLPWLEQEQQILESELSEITEENQLLLQEIEAARSHAEQSGDTQAVSDLNSVILEIKTKLPYLEEQLSYLCQEYILLKRAYMAMDVEYAQLAQR